MPSEFEFKVGETYANRRETYTVLAIEPPNLVVRFDDGREGLLDLNTQGRIVRNMALPPATPEPPARPARGSLAAKSAAAAKKAAATAGTGRGRKAATATLDADGEVVVKPRATRSRSRAAAPPNDQTLAQLCALPREEKRDKLAAILTTREGFMDMIERSAEAERERFHLFSIAQADQALKTEAAPSRSDPELLFSYSVAHNRGMLESDDQPILAQRYPLLEGGVERYVIDLLAYDKSKQTAIIVETRVKSTQRQWLWEALLEALRNWVSFSRAANLNDALVDYPVEAPPLLGVLAPSAFWADNVASSLPKISDFQVQAGLNSNLLRATRDWMGLAPLLLQAPDTWIREADEPGRPSVTPISGF